MCEYFNEALVLFYIINNKVTRTQRYMRNCIVHNRAYILKLIYKVTRLA